MRYLFYLFFTFLSISIVNAQNTDDGTDILVDLEGDGAPPLNGYRSQFNIDVGAPHLFSNAASSQAFNGIIHLNLSYGVKLYKTFYLGPYVSYSGFEYYANIINTTNPLLTNISSGLQMSYEVKLGARFTYNPALFFGFGYVQYNNLTLPTKGVGDPGRNTLTDWGFNARTNQSFYYYCTENRKIAVGLILGLNFNTHQFKFKETGITSDASISSFSDEGPTLYGNIGFGLLMNFGKIR